MIPVENNQSSYNQKINGVFGTFGAGMGIRVMFLQAALETNQLSKIQLVSEISGSDRWPVRDLFQRDVDSERVNTKILPWLQDNEKVKFFNPLTLTLIPVDPSTNQIFPEVPKLKKTELVDHLGKWIAHEREGLYRFRYLTNDNGNHREYGIVEWDDRIVKLVAIDGQHRLSALKRFLHDSNGPGHEGFVEWNVPVVISGLDCEIPIQASILDVVRNMFVYINTQAKTPSVSRQILLNDEDVNHVCVQEILQYSHENDTLEDESQRIQERPPLLFYDWRGETVGGKELPAPAALKSVVELASWLRSYVLGEHGEEGLVMSLGIEEGHSLYQCFFDNELNSNQTKEVRQRFRDWVLPGFVYLLENFIPYTKYIRSVREAELDWASTSDVYRHALSRLRFGSHRGGPAVELQVTHAYGDVVQHLIDFKQEIPLLLRLDIGMRGIVFAYGILKQWYDEWTVASGPEPWLEYSQWFTRNLNRMYGPKQDWFGKKGNDLRLHVTRNASDNIVNHKIGDAGKALGPFVCVVVCRNAFVNQDIICDQELWEEVWDNFADNQLFTTLRSGYQRQESAELKTRYTSWTAKKIKEESTSRGNQSAHAHLKRFEKKLNKIEPS